MLKVGTSSNIFSAAITTSRFRILSHMETTVGVVLGHFKFYKQTKVQSSSIQQATFTVHCDYPSPNWRLTFESSLMKATKGQYCTSNLFQFLNDSVVCSTHIAYVYPYVLTETEM